jgi:hypothetical protein
MMRESGALRFDASFSWGHVLIVLGLLANAGTYYFSDRTDTKAAVAVINAHVEQLKKDDARQFQETKVFRDEVLIEFRALRGEIEALRRDIAVLRSGR